MTYDEQITQLQTDLNNLEYAVNDVLMTMAEDLQELQRTGTPYNFTVKDTGYGCIVLAENDPYWDEGELYIELDYFIRVNDLKITRKLIDEEVEDYIRKNKYMSVLSFISEQFNSKESKIKQLQTELAEQERTMRALHNATQCHYT